MTLVSYCHTFFIDDVRSFVNLRPSHSRHRGPIPLLVKQSMFRVKSDLYPRAKLQLSSWHTVMIYESKLNNEMVIFGLLSFLLDPWYFHRLLNNSDRRHSKSTATLAARLCRPLQQVRDSVGVTRKLFPKHSGASHGPFDHVG